MSYHQQFSAQTPSFSHTLCAKCLRLMQVCGLELQSGAELGEHARTEHRSEWGECLICVKTVRHTEHFVI